MANIKSIGGNPIVLDASGIAAGAVTPDKLADMGGITAGAADALTGGGSGTAASWLERTSSADGVVTIRSIHGNTIVQDGVLVSVSMTGIETVGFNAYDPATGTASLLGGNAYQITGTYTAISYSTGETLTPDSDGIFTPTTNGTLTVTGGDSTTTCVHLVWSGYRNGEYEPYWSAQREIAASTYFPDGMRSAGSVRDELTSTEAITRVGVVDLGTLTWESLENTSAGYFAAKSPSLPYDRYVNQITCSKYFNQQKLNGWGNESVWTQPAIGVNRDGGDPTFVGTGYVSTGRLLAYDPSAAGMTAEQFKSHVAGIVAYIALATPTVTPIDPPLNLTYKVDDFGTERVMVPTGELSAPPTLVTAQGYTAESLRDAALSAIAPVENGTASTNYGVGSYLVHGGQLCKVTTAIATGEAITIGTNVTATTVMAEVIALIAQ